MTNKKPKAGPAVEKRLDVRTLGDILLSSPIAAALHIVCDRWALLIIRDQFLGYRRFEDLRRRTGAARGTLTARLKLLVNNGLLYRNPYQTSPRRYEYRLTDKGLALYPAALMLWAWESHWAQDYDVPAQLLHTACGKPTMPSLLCKHCRREIRPTEVSFRAGPGVRSGAAIPPRNQRRYRNRVGHTEHVDTTLFDVLDVIGDRWSALILGAAFYGLRRFDDITEAIGIATNILASRLKGLVDGGVFERRRYSTRPSRYEYRLTEKGRNLYGHILLVQQWSEHWYVDRARPPALYLTHRLCRKPLVGEASCSECREPLRPRDVTRSLPRKKS